MEKQWTNTKPKVTALQGHDEEVYCLQVSVYRTSKRQVVYLLY